MSLNFPDTLESFEYFMTFAFKEYQMPDTIDQKINGQKFLNETGAIRLPLPNSMVDSQHVEYSAESLSLAGAAAVQVLQGKTKEAVETLAGAGAKKLTELGASKVGLSQTDLGAVGATKGLALNPFLTVLFKSPAFKRHTLSWLLSPTNQNESKILNDIVIEFRKNMLPNQSGALGGTLLTYPKIVQVTVSNTNEYFTYQFRPAVIENFSVNFAPDGQPSFFGSTQAPTAVEIRLELMEIEYWLSEDYGVQPYGFAPKIGNALEKTSSALVDAVKPNSVNSFFEFQQYLKDIDGRQ